MGKGRTPYRFRALEARVSLFADHRSMLSLADNPPRGTGPGPRGLIRSPFGACTVKSARTWLRWWIRSPRFRQRGLQVSLLPLPSLEQIGANVNHNLAKNAHISPSCWDFHHPRPLVYRTCLLLLAPKDHPLYPSGLPNTFASTPPICIPSRSFPHQRRIFATGQ